MSRKVTAHLFSSANGVVESPNLFQFDAFGQEEEAAMAKSIAGITDVVIGTTLWKEWSEFWPGSDIEPFASFINPVRKHVVSSTLSGDLAWNSTLVEGDPVDYVKALRDNGAEGGEISIAGGIQTIRSLFVAGVVDELTLTTHPVVTPEGARLFDESVPLTRLTLVDSQITAAGNALLTYSLRD
ncbi:dihydrofolate reductase family protein [Luteipulveratus mongoliensis]|uniref:Bacterial bifunctional deaminase-reductase C-terminal domain-containing protein n=1 Tax=Luteipulveratus mongoliensis TaxID=571913 RepID=A0A0K1JLK8_9MICO|nr:dihydrofolate reductase family protein [Luteipulveratus mongoliensis]AKU17463.1 hypothetical protein VV02_19125 [Luteipulveratus mongoliensis]